MLSLVTDQGLGKRGDKIRIVLKTSAFFQIVVLILVNICVLMGRNVFVAWKMLTDIPWLYCLAAWYLLGYIYMHFKENF